MITAHPDHAKSLFTANPELVPTLTTESALAPVVGPRSVLTTNGAAHMQQRKLLLPPFRALERRRRPPFGLSLVAHARKP